MAGAFPYSTLRQPSDEELYRRMRKGDKLAFAELSQIVDENDFVEVPYAPPLATGELVHVVRTELRPAALARMGIDIDTAVADEIPADVLLGEDGFPRGVRLVETVDF